MPRTLTKNSPSQNAPERFPSLAALFNPACREDVSTHANGNRITRRFVMTAPHGFTLRAASLFAETVQQYEATVMMGKQRGALVNGKDVLGLMTLESFFGEEVVVSAVGVDAAEAIHAIERLFNAAFAH